MARYVERDCSDCGVLVAANELIPWREKQLSGTTRRSGFRTGVRGGVGFSSGGSQRYRHVNLKLCTECAGARIEAARRARFWANMRGLVTLGVIAAAVIAFLNMKPSRPTTDIPTNTANTNIAADESGNTNKAVASVGDDRTMNANAGVKTRSAPQDQPGGDDRAAQPSNTLPEEPSSPGASAPSDEVGAAITAVMPDALETGEPQRWDADGKTGYVVPSTVQTYADRSCRNVYATIIERGVQTQSPSRRWCQTNEGNEWKPTP